MHSSTSKPEMRERDAYHTVDLRASNYCLFYLFISFTITSFQLLNIDEEARPKNQNAFIAIIMPSSTMMMI